MSEKVTPKIVAELTRQLNQEFAASQAYFAWSVWCDAQNLKGFAKYFLKQSTEERSHAQRLLKHLTDRGIVPRFSELPAPKQEFRSLLEVAQAAQAQESSNTKGVHQVFEAAVAEKDYPAQVLMHWFISEQVEEEDWAQEMVDRIEAAGCAGGFSFLDRHIERYLEDEVFAVTADGATGE